MSNIFHEKMGAGLRPTEALEESTQEVIERGGLREQVEARLTSLASVAIEQGIPFEWLRIYEEKGVSDTLYGENI